jgi:hypothetical protein
MLLEFALVLSSAVFLVAIAKASKVPASRLVFAIPLTLSVALFLDSVLVSVYVGGFESIVNAPFRPANLSLATLIFVACIFVSSELVCRILVIRSALIRASPLLLILILIMVTALASRLA